MNAWFDEPATTPATRRPFEDLIVELAERLGVPTWPVEQVSSSTIKERKNRRWTR